MKYDLNWAIQQYEASENLKLLFFWGHQQKHENQIDKSCFSQWFPSVFEVDGDTYLTAEHWMMAEKARLFRDEECLQRILNAKTPGEAKKIGRQVRDFDKETWDKNKYEIVKTGNLHKFGQNEAMKHYLQLTQKRIIVEASPVDNIWGIGMHQNDEGVANPSNWKGENLLGFALMEVRDELAVSS